MGRPRSFEESELLEAVMVAFWRHGYAATTYRSLETLSGVGIRSLANTFGEKDELFTKALTRYRQRVADNLATMFDPPSVDGIIRVFERVSSPVDRDDARGSGCLMVNTVFEIDEPPEGIANEIAQYRDLWRTTFQQALETDHITDAETRAEFLLGALWGALSQIRLAGDTTAAQPMTSVIIETIRSWTHPLGDIVEQSGLAPLAPAKRRGDRGETTRHSRPGSMSMFIDTFLPCQVSFYLWR